MIKNFVSTIFLSCVATINFAAQKYSANVPENVTTSDNTLPAANFWSFTVYSTQHRSLLETDQKTAGVNSNSSALQANANGSYTVWFGPEAPAGK